MPVITFGTYSRKATTAVAHETNASYFVLALPVGGFFLHDYNLKQCLCNIKRTVEHQQCDLSML